MTPQAVSGVMKELSMHYKNTIYSLLALAMTSFAANSVIAQETTSLFNDDEEVDISLKKENSGSKDVSLDVDISLPAEKGLISPNAPAAKPADSANNDTIPMDISQDVEANFANDTDLSLNENPSSSDSFSADQAVTFDETYNQEGATSDIVPVISENIDNELFSRMSDLERQTTLLNLELKKERLANEVAAVKAQRRKALEEERARIEEEERKRQEWQNEQDRLMVEEQRKLKEAEMAMEKLRQEKVVKAYKETMLVSTQKWIKKNAEIYAEIAKKDGIIKDLLKESSQKLGTLLQKAEDTKTKAEAARVNYDKKITNLEGQIAILKTRLEAEIEKAARLASGGSLRKNPFAGDDISGAVTPEKVRLSREYAIMEITGQGNDLSAKLITIDGDVFMVKVGTTLRNGYTVDEITKTFLSAVKDDDKDYLYFSAGGILDREPTKPIAVSESSGAAAAFSKPTPAPSKGPISTQGVPSLGKGMLVK